MGKGKGEELSVNFSFNSDFLKKYGFLLLLLVPLIITIYIRSVPIQLDVVDEWARQGVYDGIKASISQQVDKQLPNHPNKEGIINDEFQKALAAQGPQIEQLISQRATYIKDNFKDTDGTTYLGDIDSYFWLRYARNILETGSMGDTVKDGKPYDTHMFSPNGMPIEPNIYPYAEVFVYKVLAVFNPKVNLLEAGYYTPMFFALIAVVAAFLIGRKLAGNLAGLVASILIAVNPIVLSRSFGSDNDIVNITFPLIIMLFTIYAFDSENLKKTAIFTAITGLLFGIYSFAWSGWWFLFLIVIGSGAIYLVYLFVMDHKDHHFADSKKHPKPHIQKYYPSLLFIGLLTLSTFIGLTLFGNQDTFLNIVRYPFDVMQLKEASRGVSIWPNVYTTVAELSEAGLSDIVGSLGGSILFFIALLGTTISFITFKGNDKNKIGYFAVAAIIFLFAMNSARANSISITILVALLVIPLILGFMMSFFLGPRVDPRHSLIMTFWVVATIYSATKGVRFLLLTVPVFSISIAVFAEAISKFFSETVAKALDINGMVIRVIFFGVICLLLFGPVQQGYATAYRYVPTISDAWVSSLQQIKADSGEGAIINSWWDFGHWFKYWSDRGVTFDGASQNNQQAHWIGKVLMTTDEDQAVAILRMLDCGGSKAEARLTEITKDPYDSVNLLYSFFAMDKEETRQELLKITTDAEAEEILGYLYCEPPADYFITSGDMVGKSGVWAHFGSWDFKRARIYSTFKAEASMQDYIRTATADLGITETEALAAYNELNTFTTDRQFNDWIAPWPNYGGLVDCTGDIGLVCRIPSQQQPLRINKTTMEAYIETAQGRFYPLSFSYNKEGFVHEIYSGNTTNYGISLLGDRTLLFMNDELTASMFTRMFYLDGTGLRHFKKFSDVTDIGGTRIIIWKVEW
ncbi:MAG: hypothetical protein HGA85_01045 [Nanoarchaeota archaeon]|nr:hypothetical protein [Nanoarchaeota archaeon]